LNLLLKNLLFTVLVPGTVAFWVPWYLVRNLSAPSIHQLLIALPAFMAGLVIYVGTVWNFARIGRGTPAPIDAPRKLIVQGPHRFVRNPMYLGVLSVILGWAIAFRSMPLMLYLVAVAIAFHLAVLLVEEPSLRRQFGAEFASYCSAVRRWLPGLPLAPATGADRPPNPSLQRTTHGRSPVCGR
jgi:protein-S-isoprenylcysteine O-methyltransferase Ste14